MNAPATPQPVAVSILDREYLIACTPEERPGLIAAAAFIDARMREIRNGARNATIDRIAVLAALNVSHELLALKQSAQQSDGALNEDIRLLKTRLEGAIDGLGLGAR
jgi:cell division protein ZapA